MLELLAVNVMVDDRNRDDYSSQASNKVSENLKRAMRHIPQQPHRNRNKIASKFSQPVMHKASNRSPDDRSIPRQDKDASSTIKKRKQNAEQQYLHVIGKNLHKRSQPIGLACNTR